jgi:MFS superfamily sulfate permease-like transporter
MQNLLPSSRTVGFRFTLSELSGALGDLGVLLPLALALITLNGVNATSAFAVLGLAYLINAFAYRLPIPVQPLKSMSATALALGLSANVVTAGAWWMAIILLGLAATNAARLIGRLFPKPVVRGIQLGLALLLLNSAWTLWQPAIGSNELDLQAILGGLVVLSVFLLVRRDWAALAVIVFGAIVALVRSGLPVITFNPALPAPALPALADFGPALWLLALPQIPLTLANSIFATEDTAQQYFGEAATHVTARRLLTTMGLSNVAVALFGGVPVCHGCGGLTAHYRLGARTGGAPLMLGAFFLLFGLLGGQSLLPLLQLIPLGVLGVLLGFVGVQHGLLARDLSGWREWLPALAVAVTTWFTRNLAIGFAAGAAMHFGVMLLKRYAPWKIGA